MNTENNQVDFIEKQFEEIENNHPEFFKLHPDLKLKDCVYVNFWKYVSTNQIGGGKHYFTCDIPEEIRAEVVKAINDFQSKRQ